MATVYVCPMHPEIRRDRPGICPKCGMALEPELPSVEDEENPELADFRRRFWWTLPLTVIVTGLAMFGHQLGWLDMARQSWIELALSLPVVFWAGRPFFVRGAQSIANRSPNMWTLIGIGTGSAFVYSVVATIAPGIRAANIRSLTPSCAPPASVVSRSTSPRHLSPLRASVYVGEWRGTSSRSATRRS